MINRLIFKIVFLSFVKAQIALPTFHGTHVPQSSASASNTYTFTNCGIVFKKNDIASLSNAIIDIFDKKDKWRLWGRNGRKYVKENHSIDNFGNKIYDIYNQSIN